MNTYIAFMRAINVAGYAIVKMTDLRDAFAAAGCKNVRTFIQSGNVVFDCPEQKSAAVFKKIRVKLRNLLGGEPGILFRTLREVEGIVKSAPFKGFETQPRIKLYVAFLADKPRINPRLPLVSAKEAVEAIAMKNFEVFIVSRPKPNGFFGFPNNFIEKELGVFATSRNCSPTPGPIFDVAAGLAIPLCVCRNRVMKSQKRFPDDIVAALRDGKGLSIRAGTEPHRFIGIWVVVVEGRVFVRSWSLKPRSWYRTFLKEPAGSIQVNGREIPVRAAPTKSERLKDAVDRAYIEKYNTPASLKYARDLGRAKSRATTMELVPST